MWGVFMFAVCATLAKADGTSIEQQCTVCEVLEIVKNMQGKMESLENGIDVLSKNQAKFIDRFGVTKNGKDCADLYKSGIKLSGVYNIYPRDGQGSMEVYCDMVTDGGGWTVFQKRQDGSIDFYRGWIDYKLGFGNLNGEFWLGNDNINRLTNQATYQLRIDMEDTSGTKVYAAYDMFSITSENTNYQLALGKYSGTAGDSLSRQNGQAFSTKDKDNDVTSGENCATSYKGAWWYEKCHNSNLNGLYHHGSHSSFADGVNWKSYKGYYYSLKRTSMKIRPAGFKSQK